MPQKNPMKGEKKGKKGEEIANQKEVLEFLTQLLRGDVKESNPARDGTMVESGPGLKDRLRAAELLGRRCGAFEEEEPEAEALSVEIRIIE